jgi:hypothetical protein
MNPRKVVNPASLERTHLEAAAVDHELLASDERQEAALVLELTFRPRKRENGRGLTVNRRITAA